MTCENCKNLGETDIGYNGKYFCKYWGELVDPDEYFSDDEPCEGLNNK